MSAALITSGGIQLDAGVNLFCALRVDRAITCWGMNMYGEVIGTMPVDSDLEPPAVFTHQGVFKQVATGAYHVCAIRDDDTVTCWGLSFNGVFGTTNAPSGSFRQVSGGDFHSCGVRTDGSLACWGYNNAGQTNVPPGSYVAVAAGNQFTCAVRSDATLACWGEDNFGQSSPPSGSFTQVAAWNGHACAISVSSQLVCWGWNREGQVTGTPHVPEDHAVYTQGGTFTQVSAGDSNTCAIRTDASLACWGWGGTLVPAGAYTNVTTGNGNMCAVRSDGVVVCQGDVGLGIGAVPPEVYASTPGATSSGANVTVTPLDPATSSSPVTVTFTNVTSAGTTTVTSTGTGAPAPLGFKLGSPPVYYELSTSATFSGAVAVCFRYNPGAFSRPANLRLFHGDARGGWTDVTTSNNGKGTICGSVTSFSPFVYAELSYGFNGFFQPVDNGNVYNKAKAGSAIPVKFSLGGDLGLDIFAANAPASVQTTCASGAAIDDIEQTVTTSASGLSYGAGQYNYVWKTSSTWAGQCRKFSLGLKDGSTHEALFQFTK